MPVQKKSTDLNLGTFYLQQNKFEFAERYLKQAVDKGLPQEL